MLSSGMDIFTIESHEQKTQLRQNWEGKRRNSHDVPQEYSPTESSGRNSANQRRTIQPMESHYDFSSQFFQSTHCLLQPSQTPLSPSLKEVSPLCCGGTCTWLPPLHTLSCNSLLIPNKHFVVVVEEITGNLFVLGQYYYTGYMQQIFLKPRH